MPGLILTRSVSEGELPPKRDSLSESVRRAANPRLHFFNRSSRVNSPNVIRSPGRFLQKALTQSQAKFLALRFHPIGGAADAIRGGLRVDVQQERQIGFDACGGDFADSPQFFDIESARVSLVDHIRQQKSVGDDRLSGIQRRANDLLDQLRRAAI